MSGTALSEALTKSGYDTGAARLATLAFDVLTRAQGVPQRALPAFLAALRDNDDLLHALALSWLQERAADMRGKSLAGETQKKLEPLIKYALASQSKADREGHRALASIEATHGMPSRSAPLLGGSSPMPGETLWPSAVPTAKPNPPRGFATMRAAQGALTRAAATLTVMDTFKVRGAGPIGDLLWCEAARLAEEDEREAAILRRVLAHAANVPPNTRIRDAVKVEVVELAIREAGHG